ncbi:MAG: hypothetical protein HZB85_03430 [Deltaproteobacteria bacterium]|nr:hypothetical protein [Deltaproteobacteria bacterium]
MKTGKIVLKGTFATQAKALAFMSGFTTVLDIGATLRHRPKIIRNDVKTLESDWKAVGKDLRVAIGRFKDEQRMSKHLDK